MVETDQDLSYLSDAYGRNLAPTNARFRVMADVSPLMIWVHDASGHLRFINRAYCEFFGVKESDVLGTRWQALVHPDDADAYVGGFLRSVQDHAPWQAIARVRRHDGEWRWIESFSAPWFGEDGAYSGAVGSTPDITEIIEARGQAEAAIRSRDEAVAMISHELRTPLTVISGWVAMLSGETTNADRVREAVAHVTTATRVLQKLADDLLDLARMTGDRLSIDFDAVNMIDVVNAAAAMNSADARAKGVELTLRLPEMPVVVSGDMQRLGQVASNLLTNAIKFTPRGGSVTATVVETNKGAALTVADTGCGISENFLPRVFDRFAQQERGGGLGLGLAIVRRIVEAHGGIIRASSAGRDQGATFEVTLPSPRLTAL